MQKTSTTVYRPAIARFTAIGSVWVFVLVMLGAFTTSIGAGMAFLDWPLSNGSINPTGWLHNAAMFAEHSHRLSAGIMSTITIVAFIWIWRTDERKWLRTFSAAAVALVLAQAVVGGLRVLLDRHQVNMVDTSLGRLFAMLHACLAQIFVCTILTLAIALSRTWLQNAAYNGSDRSRKLGRFCCALLLLQLAVAAIMRHSFAGLAITSFPLSTEDGHLLPDVWTFRVGIHFAHRVLAFVLTFALPALMLSVWQERGAPKFLKTLALALPLLLTLQIGFGVAILQTLRNPYVTTAHVLVGAITLATTYVLTLFLHRGSFEECVSSYQKVIVSHEVTA